MHAGCVRSFLPSELMQTSAVPEVYSLQRFQPAHPGPGRCWAMAVKNFSPSLGGKPPVPGVYLLWRFLVCDPELWQMPEPPKVGVAIESLSSGLIEDPGNQVICYPQPQCLQTWALQTPDQLVLLPITEARITETTDSRVLSAL